MDNKTDSENQPKHNLLEEELVSYAQAARKLPKVRGEKPMAPSTLYRWATQGLNSRTGERVYLEYICVGGTNFTSMEALARFFARRRGKEPSDAASPAKTSKLPLPLPPEKRAKQAQEVLRHRGIIK